MPTSTIQWFPGHMTKARRQMEENLKKVDFIIELRDARIPESSKNPLLDELAANKPRLILLSKKDKAQKEETKKWIEALNNENQQVLALDLLHDKFQKELIDASMKLNKTLIDRQIRKGIKPRALRAMVVGIPNVGKSTFINALARKKAAKVGDRPGVTRALQWIKVGKEIELLDTPGVLWPKFEDQKTGMLLSALGSINDEVVHLDDIAYYCMDYLMKHDPQALKDAYEIEIQETPYDTLVEAAKKRGWLKNGEVDENRMVKTFIRDIRDNRFGPITWEMPDEAAD